MVSNTCSCTSRCLSCSWQRMQPKRRRHKRRTCTNCIMSERNHNECVAWIKDAEMYSCCSMQLRSSADFVLCVWERACVCVRGSVRGSVRASACVRRRACTCAPYMNNAPYWEAVRRWVQRQACCVRVNQTPQIPNAALANWRHTLWSAQETRAPSRQPYPQPHPRRRMLAHTRTLGPQASGKSS